MTDATTTRRRLLGTGVALGAAVTLGRSPAAKAATERRSRPSRKADVVVVGAGLAGLAAARALVAAGKSVVVLEARDRVGGRTLNHHLAHGRVTELGGQFVGPTQDRIVALADALGVKRFAAYHPGDNVYVADGATTRYTGDVPPDAAIADVGKVVLTLNEMATTVPIATPWTAPHAGDLDAQTVRSWLANQGLADPARTAGVVDIFFNSAFGSRTGDVSLLFALAQVAGFGDAENAGSLLRAIGGKGGAQDSRFVGGSQAVSARAAERLGSRVVLSAPVRSIVQSRRGVSVTGDRGTWTAGHVIVAIPPPLAAEIDWRPLLSPQHDALRRRMPLGMLMKCEAVYDRPFWRDAALSGSALHLGGVIPEMFDNTPPGGRPGVLMGFLGGHSWRLWAHRPEAARRAAVLGDFAAAFGKQALKPVDYVEKDWTSDPWSRGGPVSVLGTGTLSEFGPFLAKPFGRVHWAGTETATYWNGYMDGAVSSGERAAREVLHR